MNPLTQDSWPRVTRVAVVTAWASTAVAVALGVILIIGFFTGFFSGLEFTAGVMLVGASMVLAAVLIQISRRSKSARILLTMLMGMFCIWWMASLITRWEWVWLGVTRMIEGLAFTSPGFPLVVSAILLWLPSNRPFFHTGGEVVPNEGG